MLSKTHLTLHYRMTGSRWVIIPSWSSGSWRSFLYSSSVYSYHLFLILGFPGGSEVKASACTCLHCGRLGFNSWVRKIPWRRDRLPTPVFLLGEFHEQRRLVGYSPWAHIESDTTEVTKQQQFESSHRNQNVEVIISFFTVTLSLARKKKESSYI